MSALRPNLYGLDREGLAAALAPLDPAPFRTRQVLRALYSRDALDPLEWTDIPAPLRQALAEGYEIRRPVAGGRAVASDGTLKITADLPAGGRVESVAIREPDRTTFCISSQVGCAYGCAFCMTARLGFGRHLDPGEIVGQVAALARETTVERGAYNIVFMGMGEPLHNFENVVAAVRLLTSEDGFGLGPRRITISTVGLAPRIVELAERDVPARLAVSLVTADQALRERLVPVARRHPLPELAAAIRRFGRGRRDRPTLEVVLLEGINDAPEHARKLAAYAHEAQAKVNLIEFNPAPELPYRPPAEPVIRMFLGVLARARVVGTVRRSRGKDAYAACGQLAFLESAENA